MGWFDDEEILHGAVLTAKLYPEEADPLKKVTTNAILTNGDIHNHQMAVYFGGFALNADRYFRYGVSDYVLGLPKGTHNLGSIDRVEIQKVLTGIEGEDVVIDNVVVSSLIAYYAGYNRLRLGELKFDYASKQTTVPYGNSNRIYRIKRIYTVERSYFSSGSRPGFFDASSPKFSSDSSAELTRTMLIAEFIDIDHLTDDPPPAEAVLNYELGYIDTDSSYIHVKYHVASEPSSHLRFFTYDPASKQYPDLIAVEHATETGDFFPIAPLRIDNKFISPDRNEELYDSVKKLLKRIHFKPEDLIEALKGPTPEYDDNGKQTNKDDMNEDLDKMDDCYFQFALDIYTRVEASIEYFVETFGAMALLELGSKERFEDKLQELEDQQADVDSGIDYYDAKSKTKPIPKPAPKVTGTGWRPTENTIRAFSSFLGGSFNSSGFSVKEGSDYSMSISYNYIHAEIKNGHLEHAFERDVRVRRDASFTLDNGYSNNDDHMGFTTTKFNMSHIVWRKRLTSTTFMEVTLHGPRHVSTVKKEGLSDAVVLYLDREALGDAEASEHRQDGNSGFFIPISKNGLDLVHDRMHREIILYDGAMLVIFAGEIEVIKWYQKGIFKILLAIVVFVVSVTLMMLFGPPGLTLAAAMITVLTNMVIMFAISLVVGLIAKKIGGALGAILAVIVMVVALYFTGYLDFSMMSNADMFLQAVQIFSKGYELYAQSDMMSLQEEYEDFIKSYDEKLDDLQEARDLLPALENPYDPLYVMKMATVPNPNESVSAFFDRVLMQNPGVLSLDVIDNYYDSALTLPNPDNSELFTLI